MPIIDHTGATIAEFTLRPEGDHVVLWRTPFINQFGMNVTKAQAKLIAKAAIKHDWAFLDSLDPESLPWYCRECRAIYAEKEWKQRMIIEDEEDNFWVDSVRAVCPRGHDRMLGD